MADYLLAYDLINESKGTHDYQPLWDELKRLGAHRTQYSLWLLNLTDEPDVIVRHFQKFVDKDDAIWLTRVRHGEYYYSNARTGTNDWFKKNPPA